MLTTVQNLLIGNRLWPRVYNVLRSVNTLRPTILRPWKRMEMQESQQA